MMSTKFLARFFDRGAEWPMWRKCVWLALLTATLAFICALAAGEYDGRLLVMDLLAIPVFWGASAFYVLSSGAHFVKWRRRQREHGTKTDPFMNWAAVGFFVTAVLVVVFLLGWGLDRQGVVNIPYFHQGSAVELSNPRICINDTSSLGFAFPYPAKLTVSVTEIRSIGVCPNPLNGHLLKIQGLRVNGNEYLGRDLDWVGFDPPMLLKPGEEIEVVVIGRDPYYDLPNSPLYVIKRSLPYSIKEIKGFLTSGGRDPGYTNLDWDRMEKSGLIYLDHSMVGEKRQVDAIYVTYGDVIDLPSWWQTDYYPSSHEIVRIPFTFCVKRESDMFLAGYMHDLPVGDRRMIVTIEKDGTVLVKEPDKQSILFVCNNDLR